MLKPPAADATSRAALIALPLLAIAASYAPAGAYDAAPAAVTWERDISEIVERRCASCHAPGGFASIPLTTYDEARPYAEAMRKLTASGEMPPWGAAPGVGDFANDRRLSAEEIDLMAAWAEGGALESITTAEAPPLEPEAEHAADERGPEDRLTGGTLVPLAPARVDRAMQRTASATLQLPAGLVLTAWTVEPGTPAIVERVDLEIGSRWLGTWAPGETGIAFPPDTGVPLAASTLLTARIAYRSPAEGAVDFTRLRIWMAREERPKSVRELTVVRSWRAVNPVDLIAIRPAREGDRVEVVARLPRNRVERLGLLTAPSRVPHPTYQLARPLPLAAGAVIETTAPVRLLYAAPPAPPPPTGTRRRSS